MNKIGNFAFLPIRDNDYIYTGACIVEQIILICCSNDAKLSDIK